MSITASPSTALPFRSEHSPINAEGAHAGAAPSATRLKRQASSPAYRETTPAGKILRTSSRQSGILACSLNVSQHVKDIVHTHHIGELAIHVEQADRVGHRNAVEYRVFCHDRPNVIGRAVKDGSPDALQTAARYILENPQDVALLSMRDQARKAGVQPATMTRLAQFLGLSGFDEIRSRYQEALRDRTGGFAEKALQQVRDQALEGDQALAARMFARIAHQIEGLGHSDFLTTLAEAARLLAETRRSIAWGSVRAIRWYGNSTT